MARELVDLLEPTVERVHPLYVKLGRELAFLSAWALEASSLHLSPDLSKVVGQKLVPFIQILVC